VERRELLAAKSCWQQTQQLTASLGGEIPVAEVAEEGNSRWSDPKKFHQKRQANAQIDRYSKPIDRSIERISPMVAVLSQSASLHPTEATGSRGQLFLLGERLLSRAAKTAVSGGQN